MIRIKRKHSWIYKIRKLKVNNIKKLMKNRRCVKQFIKTTQIVSDIWGRLALKKEMIKLQIYL